MDFPGEKLLVRLMETVEKAGIGLLKPWQMHREGLALAHIRRKEQLLLVQTEADIARIRSGELRLDVEKVVLRLPYVEAAAGVDAAEQLVAHVATAAVTDQMRREVNVLKAITHAENELQNDPQEPPASKPDEDWVYRWRESAGQVSDEELQQLWGKVLAEEVKKPGSTGLRTLEFLKVLSKEEANLIAKASRFVVGHWIFKEAVVHGKIALTYVEVLQLQTIGVLSGAEGLVQMTLNSMSPDRFLSVLRSHDRALVSSDGDATRKVSIPCYPISPVGQQVMALSSYSADTDYLVFLGESLKAQGLEVVLGRCASAGPEHVQFFEERRL